MRGPAYLLELFKRLKSYVWAPACVANLYRILERLFGGLRRKNGEKKKRITRDMIRSHEEH